MAYTSVKISASSSDYQSQMKSAAAQMKTLSSEYSVAATKAKLFGSAADSLKAKAETLTQKITVQKDIVKLNSEQQEKLTERLSDQKTEQEKLRTKIEEAKEAYAKSTEQTGKNSEQSKELKEELAKLEKEFKTNETAIGKTETALANQTAKTNQSKVKLMEMESELKKVNRELKDHKLDVFADACESAGKKIESFGKGMTVVSGGVLAFGTAVGKSALDTENDLMSMQGQLGLTAEETEKLKTVAQNLYTNGFGEGLADCANAVVTLMQNVRGAKDMSVEQQQAIAGQMMTMQDMFETENEELAKTLTTMLNNGIINDISEGMDVLTVGFQNGANYSGELLDTMREYSPKFKELGMDAETAMAYLIQGAESGAFNLDKVGDAMKEFSIRAIDGSDTTIDGFKRIGLNADEMAGKFAAGGDTASQAFRETLIALRSMDDPISQNIAGVDLFGTMWEDLGKDVVLSLADVEGGLRNVEGATTKAGEQINNSFSTQAKSQFRELQTSLLPLGNELLRLGKDIMPTVKTVVGDVTNALKSMDSETAQNVIKIGAVVAAIGPATTAIGTMTKGVKTAVDVYKTMRDFGGTAATVVRTFGTNALSAGKSAGTFAVNLGRSAAGFVTSAAKAGISTASLVAHKAASVAGTAATGAMTAAQTALNTVMSMNPIALVVIAVTALVAGFVLLYNKSETFRNAVNKLWSTVKEGFGKIKETISGALDSAKQKIEEVKNKFLNSGIGQAASKAFNGVKDTVQNVMLAAVSTAKEKLNNMKTAYEENGGGIKGVVAAGLEGIKGAYTAGLTFVDNLTGGKLTEIKTKFSEKTSEIRAKVSEDWTNMKETVTSKMTEWKMDASNKLDEIRTNFTTKVSGIQTYVSTGWSHMKSTITMTMQEWNTDASAKLTSLKQGFDSEVNDLKLKVSDGWTNMKTSVSTKMQEWNDDASIKLTTLKTNFSSKVTEIKADWTTKYTEIKDKATSLMESAKANVAAKLETMRSDFSSRLESIKSNWSSGYETIKSTAATKMESAKANVAAKLETMRSDFSSRLESIKSNWSSGYETIKSTAASKMEEAKNNVSSKLESIRSDFSSKLNSTLPTVAAAMENIRAKFSEKMEAASSVVSSAIEKIRGAFDFEWSLPPLKLPEIHVSGGEAPFGIGGKGSLPVFSIEWHKNGGIMTNPTVFGINGTSLLAGGEAGPEAILPLSEFYSRLNNMLDRKINAINQQTKVINIEVHTYVDSDEVTNRTTEKVSEKLAVEKLKRR